MQVKMPLNLRIHQWRLFVITHTGHLQILQKNVVDTPVTEVRCGTKAYCLWTHWIYSLKSVAVMLRWIVQALWIGMPCATKLPRTACAIQTVSLLHPQQPFPTSLVLTLVSNLVSATYPLNPTYQASSPLSMGAWCMISNV